MHSQPQAKPTGTETRAVVVKGNQFRSASGKADVGVPETSRVDKGTQTFTVTPKGDAWYVVVARGNRALAPVIPNLGEREVLPLAFSNPIWIDADGDGKFTPSRNGAK